MLDIYAGPNAIQTIQQSGFKQELFSHFLGASGGPKWFSLFGLDKYVFGEFFKDRKQTLNLVGSSAGAFRSACFAQNDPVAAITKLATRYSETDFAHDPSPQGLTRQAEQLLDYVLPDEAIKQILDNKVFKPHFIVAKSKGMASSENRYVQGLGLAKGFVLNRLNRRFLSRQFERYVFGTNTSNLKIEDKQGFDNYYVSLTKENLKPALLASGAIPLVMAGVRNIPGATNGMFRDGGIIDYHFDIKLVGQHNGLTLYPHFNRAPKAGWFDKSLTRSVNANHYNNTVMLVPSERFIQNLPYQKIPDRTDFEKIPAEQRLTYWSTVFNETDRLAQEFAELVQTQDLSKIKPLPFAPTEG